MNGGDLPVRLAAGKPAVQKARAAHMNVVVSDNRTSHSKAQHGGHILINRMLFEWVGTTRGRIGEAFWCPVDADPKPWCRWPRGAAKAPP